MNTINLLKDLLKKENIHLAGVIPAAELSIINPRLMPESIDIKCCIVFLVPYKTDDEPEGDNEISLYARSMDYHIYFSRLYERLLPALDKTFYGEHFFGFADRSPVNEKLAAAKAGLGVIGRNSLLINEEYGSYVFIGSVLSTLEVEASVAKISSCKSCLECMRACPVKAITENGIRPELCLSHLSQKKTLSQEQLLLLRKNKIVWGCDICQTVCPLNKDTKTTQDNFFKNNRIDSIDEEAIRDMPDEVFGNYAFCWRGKNVILRNLNNIKKSV